MVIILYTGFVILTGCDSNERLISSGFCIEKEGDWTCEAAFG